MEPGHHSHEVVGDHPDVGRPQGPDGNHVSDSEIFDMIFGPHGAANRHFYGSQPEKSPNRYSGYGSPVSEPCYPYYERWEPGEIVDPDFEVASASSNASSSPIRFNRYTQRRYPVSLRNLLSILTS